MASFEKNIVANLLGNSFSILVSLIFIPFYINVLGMELYGLIGFYIVLQSVSQVFDFGIGMTVNRELARYSLQKDKAGECCDFIRSAELIYWSIGIAIGLAVCFFSSLIAADWLKMSATPSLIARQAIVLIGILLIFQWPVSFYQNGLMGLSRHIVFNIIKIIISLLSFGGAALVLYFISPSIRAFFLWQLLVAVIYISAIAYFLWKSIRPLKYHPRFDIKLIKNVRNFTFQMGLIMVCALIISQADKIVLSKIVPIATFGAYMLASAFSGGISFFVVSFFNALLPHFSRLVASEDILNLKEAYHRSCQLLAVVILPITFTIVFFGGDILFVWLGSNDVISQVLPIMRILVLGSLVNSFASLSYSVQLAHGWPKLTLLVNAGIALAIFPFIFIMAKFFGVIGVAFTWLAGNIIYAAISIPVMHQRFMKGEARRWLVNDTVMPLAAVLLAMAIMHAFLPVTTTKLASSIKLIFILSGSLATALLSAPKARSAVVVLWKNYIISRNKQL